MSQNLSEYLRRKANGNGNSITKTVETQRDDGNGDEKKNKKSGNWDNLEIIIRNYEHSNILPPPLSPVLPEQFGGDELKLEIPKMLSPTLPDIFDGDDYDDDGKKRKEGTNGIKQPIPHRPNKIIIDDKDEDEVAKPPPKKRGSFEKIEHFGVHSYTLIEKENVKSLLLTLHVPSYYKNKKRRHDSGGSIQQKPIGLGIKRISEKTVGEQRASTEERIKKSSVFKASILETPPSSSSKPVLDHSSLIAKNEEYLKIAKDKKHKGDELRNKNLKISLMYFMDSVIIYLIGFNYEDQSRRLLKKLYNDKTWLSLISLIDHALKLSTDNKIVDIAGLCLQIKAVVYEHVCKILDEFIQLNNVKRRKAKTNEEILKIDETLINHFKNYSKYRELSKKSFIQSERYLSIFKIEKNYPSIIDFYKSQPERNRLVKDIELFSLDPLNDQIHLPINTGVTLKEICAYSLRVVKQWCQDENVKYNDWTI